MQVFDEIAKKFVDHRLCKLVVVGHIPGQIICGYVGRNTPVHEVGIFYEGRIALFLTSIPLMREHLVFSNRQGMYISRVGMPQEVLLREVSIKGRGKFPYLLERRYEACESFGIFNGKQQVLDSGKSHRLSEYLKYSFGLEFETSQGYVPEDICFRDGLIPLRDGSISGIEYSTVILEGNRGISLMEQQLESLRKHTDFNKECALHIHMGGFPLEKDKLFNLYRLCKYLEPEISSIVPKYTFHTSQYKANHKDYCNPLGSYRNFEQMYEHLVGRKFFNDFTQPHPNDIRREAKWRIPSRYYWVNFVNALCYNVNKTIEFRFLRPTYNFQKIVLWLYILNAILRFAEEHMTEDKTCHKTGLYSIIRKVYPEVLAERILLGIEKLNIIVVNQTNNQDFIGQNTIIEEELFSEDLEI